MNNIVDTKLRSKELSNKLNEKFGEKFYQKPICNEVCKYIKELIPEVTVLTDFQVWVKTKDGIEFVGLDGHVVIYYNNTIYDYTSDQYVVNGVIPANGLRVLTSTTLHIEEDNWLLNNLTWYSDGKNYLIAV